jgi:hypothetical protein
VVACYATARMLDSVTEHLSYDHASHVLLQHILTSRSFFGVIRVPSRKLITQTGGRYVRNRRKTASILLRSYNVNMPNTDESICTIMTPTSIVTDFYHPPPAPLSYLSHPPTLSQLRLISNMPQNCILVTRCYFDNLAATLSSTYPHTPTPKRNLDREVDRWLVDNASSYAFANKILAYFRESLAKYYRHTVYTIH